MLVKGLLASAALKSFCLVAAASIPHEKRAGQAIVPGIVFDRYVSIWLENTNFATAAADPNFAALTKQGLQLTNLFGVTHPSEPNYVSVVGGDDFGMQNDNLNNIPANVSTIVDLLEASGITWAEYEEDMPSAGFQGIQFLNPSGANDYVRKHNPLIIYESVSSSTTRSANIKNFVALNQDLAAGNIPQWVFITPNMTDDGHDSNIATASKFAVNFLTPLLKNPNFNGPKTLIVLTFDENGGAKQNIVDTVILGSALPTSLVGTKDTAFYTHYSELATVEANWGLHTLGRYDVAANVFGFVAQQTGDTVRTNPSLSSTTLSSSYPGPFNTANMGPLQIPNTSLVVNNRTVLPQIVSTWGSAALQQCTTYTGAVQIPDGSSAPVLPAGC
jgi:acid phosphatase